MEIARFYPQNVKFFFARASGARGSFFTAFCRCRAKNQPFVSVCVCYIFDFHVVFVFFETNKEYSVGPRHKLSFLSLHEPVWHADMIVSACSVRVSRVYIYRYTWRMYVVYLRAALIVYIPAYRYMQGHTRVCMRV